jgi:IclR family acetate operon transcriptional repressor
MPILKPSVKVKLDPQTTEGPRGMPVGRNQSSSLRRALDVLAAIALACESGSLPNLTEVAANSGVNRSTVSRLLQPLIDVRLVEQDAETDRYRLGPHTARLGQIYLQHLEVNDVAGPVLQALVDESQETAHLGVRDETDVVYVDKHESPLSVRTGSRIGSRQPLYSTAMGKVLLAYAARPVFDAMVRKGLPRRTATTITDPDALRAEIDRVRADGYAIDDQENELGIRCIGVPVFDHRGAVVAAISLSGPATRMTVERLKELSPFVMSAAAGVSRRLAAPEEVVRAIDTVPQTETVTPGGAGS